jgi:hypothetical protein
MKRTSEILTETAILIGGLALIGAGIYFLKGKMAFFNNSLQVEGVVIDIESQAGKKTMYYPVIAFQTLDGNDYTFVPETGTSSSFDYTKGEKVMINYSKENPQMAKIDSFKERWGLPLALLVSGLLISLAIGVKFYNMFHKMKLSKELPLSGTRLQLPGLVRIENTNKRIRYVIISDWQNPRDSKMYAFRSDEITFDPTPFITNRLMNVWIDPVNPKKNHYMDISFLPEKA